MKKNQCSFLHKSPFFNHKSLQTKSYGKQKTKALLFCSGKGEDFFLLSSKAGSTILSMPKFEWQKSELSKDLSSCFRYFMMPKFLHNILRVTLVSTGLVKLLLLAKHLSLLSVWSLLRRLIVRSFFTTPSNVC